VLAGGDGGLRHLDVHRRDREVDDEVDVGIRQHVLTRAPAGHAVLLGLGLGALGQEIAHGHDLDVGERGQVLQVGLADDSGADDTDAKGAHWTYPRRGGRRSWRRCLRTRRPGPCRTR
jgi:hypothetical protein